LRQDDSDEDWAGALIVAEALDDIRTIRTAVVAYMKALSKRR